MDSFNNKKVFFVCPPSIVQDEMMVLLINMEFEIFIINDPQQCRRALRLWPDSVFFFNVDEKLRRDEWETLFVDLQSRNNERTSLFGVLSYEYDKNLAEHYLMELNLPCGYIQINQNLKKSTEIISKTLEANEVRGRRKNIRYVIPQGKYPSMNINLDGEYIHGEIRDISSAAMVITMEKGQNRFKIGQSIEDIQLNLSGKRIKISGDIFGFREQRADDPLIILSFSKNIAINIVSDLRMFIHRSLQKQMEEQLGVSI
jgi:hypothetical protein